ncbi:MAG: decaprenyl-phosphate phosphoribosyltransferase [Andreesenia angusta]|nr:decaprenyl-phosphate phosphoribosyltransferase [Andreesenia angusta]
MIFKLLRIKQWIKNFFIFGALIFSFNFTNSEKLIDSIIAFFLFCFISSSVYILNDLVDIEKDKLHPKKRNRPLASGMIKPKTAIIIMVVLILISLIGSFAFNKSITMVLILYFINNILYSFWIKNLVILDVMSIAIGFILRVVTGGLAIDVELSPWIILCTLFISLFLGFEKRNAEKRVLEEDSSSHRASLQNYTQDMLDQFITISSTCTLIFYALYTVLVHEDSPFYLTNIFVVYGLFRYKYLVSVRNEGGSPADAVLGDRSIIFTVLLWIISCIIIFMNF